jgi:hypothetical protein
MHMIGRKLLAFIVAASCVPSLRADDAQLLDRSVEQHVASLAAIASLSARVSSETEIPEGAVIPKDARPKGGSRTLPPIRGEYVRSGLKVRVIEEEGPLGPRAMVFDYGTMKGQTQILASGVPENPSPGGRTTGGFGSRRPPQFASQGPIEAMASFLDISEGFLFTLPRPVPPDYLAGVTLAQLVKKAQSVTAERELLEGVDTVKIDVSVDDQGNRFRVWLDVNVNYLFRRIENIGPDGPRVITRVLEYVEPKPGIFCPCRGERTLPKVQSTLFTVSDIRVNEPIADTSFSTLLPKGTRVIDHSEGKVYEAGESGRADKVIGRIIESSPHDSTDSETATPLLADEPRTFSWPRIVLAASLACAIAGCIVRYRRRKLA